MQRSKDPKKYGAQLVNPMLAVSAIASDGSIVISCWAHYFRAAGKGVLRYEDRLSRRPVKNPGKEPLRSHLLSAKEQDLPVRLIAETTDETDAVDAGQDADKVKTTFHVRNDVVGKLVDFDGDFVIDFRKREAQPRVRAERPTAALLGSLVAPLLGARSTRTLTTVADVLFVIRSHGRCDCPVAVQ